MDTVDGKFANRLEYLVKVAYGAADYFSGSEISRKRDILKYVFQNLELRGKKLEYTMAKPFDIIAECNKTGEWCVEEDLNLRPQPYQDASSPVNALATVVFYP